VTLYWLQRDQTFGASVCCDLTGPVSGLVVAARTDSLPWMELLRLPSHAGLMSWVALGPALLRGYDGDSLGLTQLGLLTAAQLFAFLLVRRLSGPWPAVLAAATLPLVPGVAFGLRTWSPYPGQWAALLGLSWAVVASRSLSRPGWLLLVALFTWLGASWSSAVTDDILFLGSAGAICAAALLRGLGLGRDAVGQPVSRLRVAAGGVLLVLVALLPVLWSWGQRSDMQHLVQYTLRELGLPVAGFQPWAGQEQAVHATLADPRSSTALLAYAMRLYQWELGSLLTGLLVLPGLLTLVRGRGRAEVLAGLLLPLLVLSTLGKKQIFYVYMVLPFAVVVLAGGLSPGWPRARVGTLLRGVAGLALLALLGQRWERDSFARGWQPPAMQRDEHLFQYPFPLRLVPWTADTDVLGAWLAGVLPTACPLPAKVGCLGDELEPTDLERVVAGQCVTTVRSPPVLPPGGHEPLMDGMLVKRGQDQRCLAEPGYPWAGRAAELEADPGWRLVAQQLVRRRCWSLYVRVGGPLDVSEDPGADPPAP